MSFIQGEPRGSEGELLHSSAARSAISGFFLSGLLFAFLGAILPTWGYHLTEDYLSIGNYFLSANVGIFASLVLEAFLRPRRGVSFRLALACGIACGALLLLAAAPPMPLGIWWRLGGVFGIGCGAGVLNSAILHAISPFYRHNPAGTINLGGSFFGMGSVLVAILVAGTFYVYTVPSILAFIALIPGFFTVVFARTKFSRDVRIQQPSFRQAMRDFKSPAAILFALLLFFHFGNEWAIAGWLAVYLIQRLGIGPESSITMLAMYWMCLVVGRVIVMAILPHVSHGKLLLGSAISAMLGCTILISTNNRFGAVMGILLVGAGFASIYPLVVEKIGHRFPYYHPGFFNGIFSFALTGGLLAPWSLGIFAHLWGVRVVMGLPLLGTIMVVILLLLIWAESKLAAEPQALKTVAGR